MTVHVKNRPLILDALKAELVGPDPRGEEIDCGSALYFKDWNEAKGPFRQKDTGEEILQKDTPRIRYGVGVLYPLLSTVSESEDAITEDSASVADAESGLKHNIAPQALDNIEKIAERNEPSESDTADDFSLASANQMHQSCIGISFLAEIAPGTRLIVEASGGQYIPLQVNIDAAKNKINWWRRKPVHLRASFTAEQLKASKDCMVSPDDIHATAGTNLDLRIEVFTRQVDGQCDLRLLTVTFINRTRRTESLDAACLFQSRFKVWIEHDGEVQPAILPYKEVEQKFQDEEEQGLSLLFRKHKVYAIGHGCAADWAEPDTEKKKFIFAECLPQVEVPAISSNVLRKDKSPVEVPMNLLAGLVEGKDGFSELEEIVSLYNDWISQRILEKDNLPTKQQSIAEKHLQLCQTACKRMHFGLDYLRRPEQEKRALRAFRLANHAILLQQINGANNRQAKYDSKSKRITLTPTYQELNFTKAPKGRGNWRAFQIAFLLLSLASVADGSNAERDLVELIWFPTGGGKTEAYLGLSAFAMFLRRIDNSKDDGVQVLMRYTLRLLTAQQFQRAAGMICAMEYIRRLPQNSDLGTTPYSIGIWVGGDTTPNFFEKARASLKALRSKPYAENPFLLSRCPWCGCYFGQMKNGNRLIPDTPVIGYVENGNEVIFRCPDKSCPFSRATGLPVYVVDEAVYAKRPSLVIGTVDKFAQLTWKPEARGLFGLSKNGERESSPPDLIIQDELHLIAGPLGSMVGLYETLIEELCTDRRNNKVTRPKIVCSTATIRRFSEQIKALYNRSDAALFPPPGLDSGDSFFAQHARNDDGEMLPGKIYVGVHAPSLGSMLTTQVRVNSALLQAPVDLPADEADPWRTLLIFFNSIRELGGALTLFQADIPERLGQMRVRMGRDFNEMRRLWRVEELTSRLRNDEVPEAIQKLQEVYQDKAGSAVDVCLASNIIEVGVDIDRLSLMSVVGQPKTTSQYIQVTGRVGRRQYERPGIVVTIYNPSKPRDRSHFEKFKSYHERLYSQVEPTSVTPFSPPLVDRALHALVVAYIRQTSNLSAGDTPLPYPEHKIKELWSKVLLPRIKQIDPEEEKQVKQALESRVHEWDNWKPDAWRSSKTHSQGYLMRAAGEYVPADVEQSSWSTPTSLRNVDAECQAQITQLYLEQNHSAFTLDDTDNGDN